MSISVEQQHVCAWQRIKHYLLISLLLAVFGFVYEQFSHGVSSPYMIYMFGYFFVGGVIPYIVIMLIRRRIYPPHAVRTAYDLGLTTLTIGSGIKGIIDIYGTTSIYLSYYWIGGGLMIFAALLAYISYLAMHKGG